MATPQQTGLFYMGAAPQAVLKGFPIEFNKHIFKQLDSTFLIILAVSFVLLSSTFFILSLRPLPEVLSEKEILKIQERYAQLILNQPKKKVEEAIEEVEAPLKETREGSSKAEKEKEKVKVDRKSESVVQKKQRKEATRKDRRRKREAISQKLQSSGIFAAITSTGSGITSGGSSPVTDLLGTASGGIGDIGGGVLG